MHTHTAPLLSCSVATHYLPEQSSAAEGLYAFAYTLTLRNTGAMAAQVIARHWVIQDGAGHVENVRGLAVVGQQPLIKPGGQFEYTSWTRIATPRGTMRGTLFCITEDAHWFELPIPAFELSQNQALH